MLTQPIDSTFAGLDGQIHVILPWINAVRRDYAVKNPPRVFPPVLPRHCVRDAIELLWPLMTDHKVKNGQWPQRRHFNVCISMYC